MFTNAEIKGDSLALTIQYGGGCGNIELNLIDADVILESYPVQRNIRLSLKDEDPCKKLVIKEISFDIVPIRVDGDNTVILNLQGWDGQLTYQY
jgi:hypothetical protein